ncbi:MAG: hypothetical protein L6R39_005575 [Caloplaca ligustica]|nr:MAG: hypothetical protein L6R39_005575 [Caloplaca ligustica]
MPDLRAVPFDGMLHPQTLQSIIWVRYLHTVQLRGTVKVLENLRHEFDDVTGNRIRGWNQLLDFRLPGSLLGLRKLHVGRLTPKEARGLAVAVVKLDLTWLFVAAAPPARDGDDSLADNFRGTIEDGSPLLTFPKAIPEHSVDDTRAVGPATGCLPQTSKVLILIDHYRAWEPKDKDVLLLTLPHASGSLPAAPEQDGVRP